MALFKISKGLSTNLMTNVPNAKEGFAYFTTDDGKFYIDIDGDGSSNTPAAIGNNRIPLNAYTSDILKATSMGTNDNVVYPLLTFKVKDSTKNLIEAKYGAIGIKNGTLVIPNVNNNDEILISNTGAGRGIVIDNTNGVGHAIEITAGKGIKVAKDPVDNLELATKQYVDKILSANDAMIFKGILDDTHKLPDTHETGWTYRVNKAGTYAGKVCEIGDLVICTTDGLSANDAHWTVAQTNIDGAVIGPNTSTANAVSTFADATGKVIKDNPAVTIDDTGLFTAPYIATGTNETNYFQSKKFRGEGNANTYYHAVDFGYAGHNQVDFHEYGGTWNFYENTKGTAADGKLVASIKPDGFHGNLKGNADTATKVNNNLVIKLNSGTTEGTNQFTYNGSDIKNINITSSSIGAASSSHNHDDRYSTAISITIPKGRMLGDVDGDGEITGKDLTQMADHNSGAITLTGVDFWCADINGDGSITTVDINIVNFYILGRPGPLSNTPLFTDYYNNWTYVKVDALSGYWTTEIATSGITTQNDIIINIFDLFSLGQFYKADILTNKIKLYATRPPIEDLKALITIRPGSGRVSIPAYSPEITLSSLGAAAQNHNHNSIYVINTGDIMTGNLAIEKSSNSTSFTTTRTDTGSSVSFMVGSDGTNRGVYDNNLNAWIIYSDGTDARTQLKLYGAVWNDYAEFREGDTIEAGRCVVEIGDDTLITSTERMMPGANIISDTFGFAIGETEQAKTPIAVSGRVLAYPYESCEEFKKNIGRPVCSGPNGTVSIMTDEEYRNKGYCAIGTISAVPDYEEWGAGKVKVNGRVWIKVF